VPSIKQPPALALTLGSELVLGREEGLFRAVEGGGFVFTRHVAPVDTVEHDPVAVAERFLGVPYLWGGKTSLGLDCSGLVQTALFACGRVFARDSDMQEREAGESLDPALAPGNLRRGDLLFWKGHVALVRDGETMIHATGHTMTVAIEGVASGIARIAAAGDVLRTVKRLGGQTSSSAS
jgi:cell wall-associated NlpC family hydrolase